MKKRILIAFVLTLLFTVPSLTAQKLIKNSLVTGVCYAGNKVKKIYIPPPNAEFMKSGLKGGGKITIYYIGFPSNIVPTMEYAVNILESVLPPDANVTVYATWENLSNNDILANTTITGYAGGWIIDALDPFAYYPVPLAEKIYGSSLNDTLYPDVELNVNSSINWYIGINGLTPVTQYDLVTVVIHELMHGLGFFDSMNVVGSLGSYGAGTIPVIYDKFLENAYGKKLTDTLVFNNPSVELKNELTGGQLYFNGPLLSKYTLGGKAKLYAPVTWDSGSSASHLDDANTPAADGLMTPFIDMGEAIHNPGGLTMSILGDLGWINTRIVHTPPGDTEEPVTQLNISAEIKSDTAYNHNKVGLVWSFDEFASSDTVLMTSPQSNDSYTAVINIPAFESELQYYIYAEDHFLRIYRSPSMIDLFKYRVYIGTDTVRPQLAHTPVLYYLESVDTIRFDALALDNIGIDTVYVEYKINDGPISTLGLKAKGGLLYSNTLVASELTFNGGDSLKYRIIAVDKAASPNTRTLPASGFFAVNIEDIGPVLDAYSTNFVNAGTDFFNSGFEIIKPNAFSNFGLHSKHPYESPEADGESITYVAMLRNPIKFDANGMVISYMDLALVEPGIEGSVFGTEDFFDYVVIEGSKDFGKSWFAFGPGYDCRYQDSWEKAYNSSIFEENSTYAGTESMLIRHTYFPVANSNFSAGDTLMVRFRLFSDPYAYGWGWAIEDFHIGPLINSIEDPTDYPLVVYPNPGRGILTISGIPDGNNKPLRFNIFNSSGALVLSGLTTGESTMNIDISSQPAGIYFVKLFTEGGIATIKYSLIK